MKKKVWYGVLVCLLLMKGIEAEAQTVLVLSSEDEHQRAVAEGFRAAFSGRFEVTNLEASEEKLRKTGESLSANPPSLLLVSGNLAAQMAKWYLEGVPTIYCSSSRASAIGLERSNVYGIFHAPSLKDQLSALREIFPERKKIGLMYNGKIYQDQVRKFSGDVQASGVVLVEVKLSNIKEVPVKTREIVTQVDLLWVLEDPELVTPHTFPYIVLQSVQQGVPVFSGNEAMSKGGATAAFTEDEEKTGGLLARLARGVIEGKAPSPRVQFPPGKLILNARTASVMSVQFPQETLKTAAKIIE